MDTKPKLWRTLRKLTRAMRDASTLLDYGRAIRAQHAFLRQHPELQSRVDRDLAREPMPSEVH